MGSKSHRNGVLNSVLGRQVTNFLVSRVEVIGFGHELAHLLIREHSRIANVVEGLNLVQVSMIVYGPKVMVVSHADIELLHQFRSSTASRDSTINVKLRFEEFIILIFNFADDFGGVNILFIIFPVNWSEFFSSRVLSIVVIKNGVQLRELLSGNVSISGSS